MLLLYKSYSLNDESDNDWSDLGSSGTYYFRAISLHFDDSVGSGSDLGSDGFVPTGVESKCDIFTFDVLVPIGFKSKGGRLIEMFWHSNSLF